MKKISEMQLADISNLIERIDRMEDQVHISSIYEDKSFLFVRDKGWRYLSKVKILWLMQYILFQSLGENMVDNDMFQVSFSDDMEDYDTLIGDWYQCGEWAEERLDQCLSAHGYIRDNSFAAISYMLSKVDEDNLEGSCGRYVEEQLYEEFQPYDKEKQLETAMICAEVFDMGYGYIESYTTYRNKRIGRIATFVDQQDACIMDQEACLFRKLMDRIEFNMYRYYAEITSAYVSCDDGAWVLRLAEASFYDSSEEIEFALIRPFVLIDIVLMERVCELLEESYPQLKADQREAGELCA